MLLAVVAGWAGLVMVVGVGVVVVCWRRCVVGGVVGGGGGGGGWWGRGGCGAASYGLVLAKGL